MEQSMRGMLIWCTCLLGAQSDKLETLISSSVQIFIMTDAVDSLRIVHHNWACPRKIWNLLRTVHRALGHS